VSNTGHQYTVNYRYRLWLYNTITAINLLLCQGNLRAVKQRRCSAGCAATAGSPGPLLANRFEVAALLLPDRCEVVAQTQENVFGVWATTLGKGAEAGFGGRERERYKEREGGRDTKRERDKVQCFGPRLWPGQRSPSRPGGWSQCGCQTALPQAGGYCETIQAVKRSNNLTSQAVEQRYRRRFARASSRVSLDTGEYGRGRVLSSEIVCVSSADLLRLSSVRSSVLSPVSPASVR
jgi:hypothetical protein